MSGLREIIQWVESELILDPKRTVDQEFEDISTIFEDDNRSALANILRDETPQFLEFLERSRTGVQAEPEDDEDLSDLERRLESVESELDRLFRIIEERGKELIFNILGTPIR